jgi:hypothetical protein
VPVDVIEKANVGWRMSTAPLIPNVGLSSERAQRGSVSINTVHYVEARNTWPRDLAAGEGTRENFLAAVLGSWI